MVFVWHSKKSSKKMQKMRKFGAFMSSLRVLELRSRGETLDAWGACSEVKVQPSCPKNCDS